MSRCSGRLVPTSWRLRCVLRSDVGGDILSSLRCPELLSQPGSWDLISNTLNSEDNQQLEQRSRISTMSRDGSCQSLQEMSDVRWQSFKSMRNQDRADWNIMTYTSHSHTAHHRTGRNTPQISQPIIRHQTFVPPLKFLMQLIRLWVSGWRVMSWAKMWLSPRSDHSDQDSTAIHWQWQLSRRQHSWVTWSGITLISGLTFDW